MICKILGVAHMIALFAPAMVKLQRYKGRVGNLKQTREAKKERTDWMFRFCR
jgi:hypothetical protein